MQLQILTTNSSLDPIDVPTHQIETVQKQLDLQNTTIRFTDGLKTITIFKNNIVYWLYTIG